MGQLPLLTGGDTGTFPGADCSPGKSSGTQTQHGVAPGAVGGTRAALSWGENVPSHGQVTVTAQEGAESLGFQQIPFRPHIAPGEVQIGYQEPFPNRKCCQIL